MANPVFYRQRDLIGTAANPKLLPVSAATLWRWVKEGIFPKPTRLGPNLVAWPKAAVDQWISDRNAEAA